MLSVTTIEAEEVVSIKDRDASHSVRELVQSIGETKEKNISDVTRFEQMFADGKVTGQLKSMYAGYNYTVSETKDTYATAVGGQLKYELAELNGFNAAAAFYTTQNINFATGNIDNGAQNSELSSSKGNLTELAEAYINYKYDHFNFRAGRQVINTPLADNDDIRMMQNTFEAYIATYQLGELTFMAGNLQKWQGYDAGLDKHTINVGPKGAWLGSASFSDDILDASAWYYNIPEFSNIFYTDVSIHYNLNQDIFLHVSAQYIHEDELNHSTISTDIYGTMAEVILHRFSVNLSYNKASVPTGKQTFSGFGGGSLYTNMDTKILNDIAIDRNADAIVGGMSYKINDFKILYAYGDFHGDKNSLGQKAYMVEQDVVFEYNVKDNFLLSATYAVDNDKENPTNPDTNWNRYQIMIAYNF